MIDMELSILIWGIGRKNNILDILSIYIKLK